MLDPTFSLHRQASPRLFLGLWQPLFVFALDPFSTGVSNRFSIDYLFSNHSILRPGTRVVPADPPREVPSHAAILPLYFLHQNSIHPDTDLTVLRFDTDVGKHGDTGTSEEEVIRAVLTGQADAGALGKATWDANVAAGRIDPQKLRIFWTSPGYCHCNFTARADFPTELAQRFTQALLAMDYQQPEQKRIMDLEGLIRWVSGRTDGYQELEDEARDLDLLS